MPNCPNCGVSQYVGPAFHRSTCPVRTTFEHQQRMEAIARRGQQRQRRHVPDKDEVDDLDERAASYQPPAVRTGPGLLVTGCAIVGAFALAYVALRVFGYFDNDPPPHAAHGGLDPGAAASISAMELDLGGLSPTLTLHVRGGLRADGTGPDTGPRGVGPVWLSWDVGRVVRVTHIALAIRPRDPTVTCGVTSARILGPDGTAVPVPVRGPNAVEFDQNMVIGTGPGFVVSFDTTIAGPAGARCGPSITLTTQGHVVETRGIEPATWRTRGTDLAAEGAGPLAVLCPAAGTLDAEVFGTDHYAMRSSICAAAVHAGWLTVEHGGLVSLQIESGARGFAASTRNGVAARSANGADRSFHFPSHSVSITSATYADPTPAR